MKLSRKRDDHRCDWRAHAEALEEEITRLHHHAAFEDPSTGLGNVHQFYRDAARNVARYRRHVDPFAVALFEVQSVNAEGPGLTEASVAQLARVLLDAARLEDSVCRLGENRFGVVLANATGAGAARFVERVADRIGGQTWGGAGHAFLQVCGGAAQWQDAMQTIADLLSLAEEDLGRRLAQANRLRSLYMPHAG
jgi:GGDEF domain-containing protein